MINSHQISNQLSTHESLSHFCWTVLFTIIIEKHQMREYLEEWCTSLQ